MSGPNPNLAALLGGLGNKPGTGFGSPQLNGGQQGNPQGFPGYPQNPQGLPMGVGHFPQGNFSGAGTAQGPTMGYQGGASGVSNPFSPNPTTGFNLSNLGSLWGMPPQGGK